MPFGFFGSLGALAALAVVIPLALFYVWSGGVARPSIFLLVAIVVGLVAAVAVFWWHIQPLSGIALSGERVEGSRSWSEFEASLHIRYFWAASALACLQVIGCFALRSLLGKGVAP